MSNMSYCRFQNTLQDLRDCKGALDEEDLPKKDRSPDEYRAMVDLLEVCQEIVDSHDPADYK